jgi:hypothetical protein
MWNGDPRHEPDEEYECDMCGRPISEQGYCSNGCFNADN